MKPKFRFENVRPHKTFIIPTQFGILFGIQCLVIVVLAIGYGNNVLYLFVFFLIGVALVSTVVTNQNTDKVEVLSCEPLPAFVNESTLLNIKLSNKSSAVYDLEVQVANSFEKVTKLLKHTECRVQVPWVPTKRGEQESPKILVRSRYPFGLTMSWKVFKINLKIIVFPELKGKSQFPEGSEFHNVSDDIGVFMNHREFAQGDSYRRVDWRASARHGELLSKVFDGPRKRRVSFTWEQTQDLTAIEDRISQLALWVVLAEKEGYEYSLNNGETQIETGSGLDHNLICLNVLSLMSNKNQRVKDV
jgi:uncharacterized protein (DUF58 family)